MKRAAHNLAAPVWNVTDMYDNPKTINHSGVYIYVKGWVIEDSVIKLYLMSKYKYTMEGGVVIKNASWVISLIRFVCDRC